MNYLTITVLVALAGGAGTTVQPGSEPLVRANPAAAAPARAGGSEVEPADSSDVLWKEARDAVSDGDFDRAAVLFRRVRERFPKSAHVGDSYYWEAYALSKDGGSSRQLRQAVDLLETQQSRYASATTVKSGDSRALTTRIKGWLAASGDAASAADITRSATAAARAGSSAASAASTASGAASAASRATAAEARAGADAAREASRGGRTRSGNSVSGCKDEDDDERVEALNALLQMSSEQAMPLLKQVLARRDPCSEVLRRKAVFLVSQKRTDEAADLLLATAKNDPDRETREQAVQWLSNVHSPKAVTFLEQLLKTSTDEDVQDKAIFALAQASDGKGRQVLRDYAIRDDVPSHVREQVVFWIGQRGGEEDAVFLKQLFAKSSNAELQQSILQSVSRIRGEANDQWLLDQAVNRKNSTEVRNQALFWASQQGRVSVAKLAALYDKADDHEFRNQVIFVLSRRSNAPEAVDKLIEIARTEKDKELRSQAVFWLGRSRDPRAVKALMEIINK